MPNWTEGECDNGVAALAAARAWARLWKQRAKRHRELHHGAMDAAAHFAGQAREMAALATHNADLCDAARNARDELAAQVAELGVRLAALEQDAARFDWLQRHAVQVSAWDHHGGDGTGWALSYNVANSDETRASGGGTLAEAIDAARATEGHADA